MYKKFPYPKRYYVYLAMFLILGALLILNIIRTDNLTGNREITDFSSADWKRFFICLAEEVFMLLCMFLSAHFANRINAKRESDINSYWDEIKFSGIKPGDYDCIFFDYDKTSRALIMKNGDSFLLYINEYDIKHDIWNSTDSLSIYSSLSEVKKSLFYDYAFYCEENSVWGENEEGYVFKEN